MFISDCYIGKGGQFRSTIVYVNIYALLLYYERHQMKLQNKTNSTLRRTLSVRTLKWALSLKTLKKTKDSKEDSITVDPTGDNITKDSKEPINEEPKEDPKEDLLYQKP